MDSHREAIEDQLGPLKEVIAEFSTFFRKGYDYSTMIYEFWDAKDILGHIAYWHESFARNIADVGEGRKPNPLRGKLSEVNKDSVDSTREVGIEMLIERINAAQRTVEKHIYNERIEQIPYKRGSRDYTRLEHLEIVTNHIRKHLKDLKKGIKNG